jgi:hypothetical protein
MCQKFNTVTLHTDDLLTLVSMAWDLGNAAPRKRSPRSVGTPRVEVTCPQCGHPFTIWASTRKRGHGKFCSKACAFAARQRPIEERFWANVDKSGDCWLWTAALDVHGYGRFRYNKQSVKAHRVAWELLHRPIPDGLFVLHNCPGGDNRRCIRPDHMFLGTQADNMRDMDRKGRRVSGMVYGVRHGMAKLNPDAVRAIRAAIAAGEGYTAIARRHGVTDGVIRQIALGRTWKHVA